MTAKNFLLFFLVLIVLLPYSSAHDFSLSFTSVYISLDNIIVNMTVPVENIVEAIPDGVNVQSNPEIFNQYFSDNFIVLNNGIHCFSELIETQFIEESNSLTYSYEFLCEENIDNLSFEYYLFFDVFEDHEGVTIFYLEDKSVEQVFTPDIISYDIPVRYLYETWGLDYDLPKTKNKVEETELVKDFNQNNDPSIQINQNNVQSLQINNPKDDFKETSWLNNIFIFFKLGIKHILTGYDHILFLLGLLLIAMHFKYLVKIVTSFTIAHSITLILATLGIFILDPRYTEAIIALSIAYVAFENLYIKFVHKRSKQTVHEKKGFKDFFANPQKRWKITFLFGLIHGFGFSSVLRSIGLPKENLISSLLAFNIGVEVGQLGIVAIIFPYIWITRNHKYHDIVVKILSIIIGFIGLFWFFQRVFLGA